MLWVAWLNYSQKFQLNGDHTAVYDMVLLAVFQLVRNDFQTTYFIQRF